MSKKKLIGIIVASVIGIFVVLAIAIPSEPTSTPSTTPTSKEIVIGYSSYTTDQIVEWNRADPGYTYLVIDLDIENRGYDSFNTSCSCFLVIVNNVKYEYSDAVLDLEDCLRNVDLLDGGRISGKTVFEVPEEVVRSGYQLKYESWEEYSIQWIKQ